MKMILAPFLKRLYLSLLLCCGVLSVKAQVNRLDSFPSLGQHKGALIFINEMHGCVSNAIAYLDVLQHISRQLSAGDTINLFLEIPFSASVMLNDLFADTGGDSTDRFAAFPNFRNFLDELYQSGIPVRFFGCDFEYDEKYRRNGSLVYLLEKLQKDLGSSIDRTLLQEYISLVKTFRLKAHDTKGMIEWLRQQTKVPEAVQREIGQLIFALQAPQQYSPGRDQFIFERAARAIALHYFEPRDRFNITIHGGAHVNPSFKGSLFNRFRKDRRSSFRDKCRIIGNVYVDCKNNAGIFDHENIASASFYVMDTARDPVITYYKKQARGRGQVFFQLPPGTGMLLPDLMPGVLLGIYLHDKTGLAL
ncbi:hypothetical protein [Taibaiella koreensis]|uniref:hypothetical protein n=1 Tax=Taibaiella koreensis TaxID=1268548 RepID=UPI00196910E7|nr:hypothetical protein [Taibaiella koreensis]